jgi:hypothetical protein
MSSPSGRKLPPNMTELHVSAHYPPILYFLVHGSVSEYHKILYAEEPEQPRS